MDFPLEPLQKFFDIPKNKGGSYKELGINSNTADPISSFMWTSYDFLNEAIRCSLSFISQHISPNHPPFGDFFGFQRGGGDLELVHFSFTDPSDRLRRSENKRGVIWTEIL